MTTKKKSAGKKLQATKTTPKKIIKNNNTEYGNAFDEASNKPDKLNINQTFIDDLLAGKLRLTDKLFLSKVDESLDYLRTKPFQDRVSDWLIACNWEMIDDLLAAITPERRGCKHKVEEGAAAWQYYDNCVLIYDFKDKHPSMSDATLNQAFLKEYPDSDIRFDQHRSVKEIAIHLTVKQLGISKRTLRKIISKVQVLPIRPKAINKILK